MNPKSFIESFSRMKPLMELIEKAVYMDFIENNPSCSLSIFEKRGLFSKIITFLVEHLDDEASLREYFQRLDLQYGTLNEVYEEVGTSFIKVLREIWGEKWDEDLETQWKNVYKKFEDNLQKCLDLNEHLHRIIEKMVDSFVYEEVQKCLKKHIISIENSLPKEIVNYSNVNDLGPKGPSFQRHGHSG